MSYFFAAGWVGWRVWAKFLRHSGVVSLHLVGANLIKWSNSAQTTETCYSAPVWVALLTNIAETAFSMQNMVRKNQSKHLTGDLMWPSDDHPIHLLEI